MDAVLLFLPVFDQPGFLFAKDWKTQFEEHEREGRGCPGDLALEEIPTSFLETLIRRGFPRRRMRRRSAWSMEYVRNPIRLLSTDLETLCEMIPDLFYGARITGGFMADLFNSGFWTCWLRRLKEIRDGV